MVSHGPMCRLCGQFKIILEDLINGTSRIEICRQERLSLGKGSDLSPEEWKPIPIYAYKIKALFQIAENHALLC